ncbi:MAG: LPXTG cell wall anchor domain-containing protein, partial [Oscillospiraceae bacterium]|nr:LPXTG cell wall anchor domain-containing protein [Oscillospiraceae bacterium]
DGKNMLDFQFDLTGTDSTGEINDRKTVDPATNTVTFDTLNFTTAGTYVFTVKEYRSILGGFIKWDATEYTVTIKVIDNGVGKLEIENITYADENGDPATNLAFHNGYQMEDNQLVLSVIKTMTGDATTGRDFSFGLYTDLNAEPVDTVTVTGVTKASAAEASFDAIPYKQADVATGTFTYYIKEIIPAAGNPADGITYDETVYTVVVTLTDDEQGNIGISYTVNGNDVDEATYKFAFQNKYEQPPVPTPTEPAPSDNPKTGDTTPVTLLAVLMLFSLACLFVLVLSRKRETH